VTAKTRNPFIGMHPDLFARGEQVVPGESTVGVGTKYSKDPAALERMAGWQRGETPMFVPLSELDSDQIRKLPRLAFSNDEWDDLDDDDREWIEDHDEESQERVDALADPFIKRYKWEAEGSDRDYSTIEDGLEYYLSERADKMYEEVPSKIYDELVEYATERGVPEADVDRILNELLVDTNNYEISTESYVSSNFIYSEEIRGNVYVERSDWIDEFEACTPDEVERAVAKIAKQTDHVVDVDAEDLAKQKYSLEFDFDTGMYMVASIKNWEHIADSAREGIDEVEVPDDKDMPGALPPESRVVYRWPDGFYVQDLLPSELPAEGKTMGMCVGRADMGYGKAVREGTAKILSLRRPSGKPLFTIEAATDLGGRVFIESIDQIKGKANRKPGFDLGKDREMVAGYGQHPERHAMTQLQAAMGIKRDEVERVLEYVLSIPIDPATVDDLQPAMAAISVLRRKDDPWGKKLAAKIPGFKMEEETPEETPRWIVSTAFGITHDYTAQTEARARELHARDFPDEVIIEIRRANPARRNPVECPMGHGAGCTGFCRPYRRRRRP
jgi:hypothetical protein